MEPSLRVNSTHAQDLAGKAILFEIGAKAGLLDIIEDNDNVTIPALVTKLNIEEDFLTHYLDTLSNIGLLNKNNSGHAATTIYQKSNAYYEEKNKIGYIAWGMLSCGPLIANTADFIANFDKAIKTHQRSGEHVARTSKWMGETDFYPHAEKAILALQPKRTIDLGSGTCGLLIRLARQMPEMTALGIDLSKSACEKAKDYIKEADLENRIDVMVSPIQQLIHNTSVFTNVDVVHAGFVFHDLMPEEEETLDKLLAHMLHSSPQMTLVIADAIPFANNPEEMAFSSAFSFLHKFFMGRQLLSESLWQNKLKKAGFNRIKIERLGISGGRIFIADNK